MATLKRNLNRAFAQLRKLGYTAKQNFWCCSNCAWNALEDDEAEKVVFYHQQDNADLKKTGSCYLAWGGNGEEIVKVLTDNGVKVHWDGDKNKRIRIDINIE
jgi:hypothetical protein